MAHIGAIDLSNQNLAELLARWGFEREEVSDIVLSETGEISGTAKYVGTQYVLKAADDPGKAVRAFTLTEALAAAGLAAPAVIPTLDGADYVQSGTLCFYLCRRVEGEHFPITRLYLEPDGAQAHFLGQILGKLDLALVKIDLPVEEADPVSSVCDWAIPVLQDALPLEIAFTSRFTSRLCALYAKLPRQIIHRDPNPANILLSSGKWGFIDFELSERNARIFDPCYAALAILSESYENGNQEKLDKWTVILREILRGYDAAAKLSDLEKEAIPYLLLTNQLIATAWFYENPAYQKLYETNANITDWLIRNFDRIRESIRL